MKRNRSGKASASPAWAVGLLLPILCAGCAPKPSLRGAGDEFVAAPPTPDRYDLPRVRDEGEGKTIPAGISRRELERIIATPGTSRRKVDAAMAWSDRFSGLVKGREFWDRVADSLDLMDLLFARETDPDYRRFAIVEVFGAASASVRDAVPFHLESAPRLASEKRLDGLRLKGLHDSDARLAEYFERYVPLDADPDWSIPKRRNSAVYAAALKSFPEKREALDELWRLESSIEDSQRSVLDRLTASARKDYKAEPAEVERLVRRMKTVFDYRLYSSWGNLCSRALREQLGAENAARLGVKVDPVKLGWLGD